VCETGRVLCRDAAADGRPVKGEARRVRVKRPRTTAATQHGRESLAPHSLLLTPYSSLYPRSQP
jgi:hypothetical protein